LGLSSTLISLLLLAGAALPQSFHDDALNITYFYPVQFALAPAPAADTACSQTTLLANAITRIGASSFTVSTVDNTCPDRPRDAAALGPFIRGQIWNQLRQQGVPAITREPLRYLLGGRPAAITLASATTPGKVPHTTYAAKACALGEVPSKHRKKSDPVAPAGRVLCFDFTTDNGDLVSMMFSFIIQFGDNPPEPLFLASAQPKR
jgi:hypothetical protein